MRKYCWLAIAIGLNAASYFFSNAVLVAAMNAGVLAIMVCLIVADLVRWRKEAKALEQARQAGDDHIECIKSAIKNTFPELGKTKNRH